MRRVLRTLQTMCTERISLAGVFPPIVTPFTKDTKSLDVGALEANFRFWNSHPLRGYVVLGSNGEFALMNDDEKLTLVREAKRLTPPDRLLIVGCGGTESTIEHVNFAQKVHKLGADALLVVTPCFYKSSMTPRALEAHYIELANQSPLPIIVYNVPSNTGVDLDAQTVISLSKHANIIGLKDSGGDITKLGLIAYKTASRGFQVLAGSAGFFLPALHAGCVGSVAALANVLPGECCELYSLFKAGRMDEARGLQGRLIAPNTMVTRKFGVPALKFVMDKAGHYGGPVRLPLLPLSADEESATLKEFTESGFKLGH